MEVKQLELLIYQTPKGECPFEDWFHGLRDVQARAVIRKRLNRLRLGNVGDCKMLDGGVLELRVDFGPGYRIYFGKDHGSIVVLLVGGDKSTQTKDIRKAQDFWKDYKAR